MKYILAILMSVSLYAPDIARFVAYADLMVDVVSEKQLNICDCEGILEQRDRPTDHQEYMTVVTTDFKYVVTQIPAVPVATSTMVQHSSQSIIHHPTGNPSDIFQPPRV